MGYLCAMASRARELLQQPSFLALLTVRVLVVLANQAAAVAIGWRVYDLTKDPAWLGYTGLAEAIPAIALALYAGHVADHTSRHKQMLATLLLLGVCMVMRLLTVIDAFSWSVSTQLVVLFSSILLDGVARAFFSPAYFGLQAEVVAKEDLTDAVSMLSGSWQASAVIGPAIGGFIYAWAGPLATFGFCTFFALASAAAMYFVPARPAMISKATQPIWQSIKGGLRFVLRHQIILGAISLDLFAVLLGGAVALLPAFCDTVLQAGPQGLGLLRAAPAIGAVLMAIILFGKKIRYPYGPTLLAVVAGFGACMVVFGLSEVYWISLLAVAMSGALDHISVIIRITIMQTYTPEDMRGRVSAVESIFITSSNEIGALESGLTASWWGLQRSVVIGGLLSIGVVGLISWLNPALRKLKYPSAE